MVSKFVDVRVVEAKKDFVVYIRRFICPSQSFQISFCFQSCFTEQIVTTGGNIIYNSGCLSNSVGIKLYKFIDNFLETPFEDLCLIELRRDNTRIYFLCICFALCLFSSSVNDSVTSKRLFHRLLILVTDNLNDS